MNETLTQTEINKIRNKCFENPAKMCAVAQEIIDTCQIITIATYAKNGNKHRNTILQQKEKLTGIEIENRKYISLNQ